MSELGILGTLVPLAKFFFVAFGGRFLLDGLLGDVPALLTLLNHGGTLKMMTTMTMQRWPVCWRAYDFSVEEMLAIIDK